MSDILYNNANSFYKHKNIKFMAMSIASIHDVSPTVAVPKKSYSDTGAHKFLAKGLQRLV